MTGKARPESREDPNSAYHGFLGPLGPLVQQRPAGKTNTPALCICPFSAHPRSSLDFQSLEVQEGGPTSGWPNRGEWMT